MMKDKGYDDFQELVDYQLVRHRSILDILSKYQESASRVNRAVAKSVTSCGCIEIEAKKQDVPKDVSLSQLKQYMDSHLREPCATNARISLKRKWVIRCSF